jgi:hypothetical protein
MRPTPGCQAFRDDLKAYADGELPLARRVAVRAHVSRCADCKQELMEMERITEAMKKQGITASATLAPDLRARLLSRLEGVKPEAPATPPLWKRQPLMVFGGGGAAVLASALVFALMYGPAQQNASFGRSAEVAPPSESVMKVAAKESSGPVEGLLQNERRQVDAVTATRVSDGDALKAANRDRSMAVPAAPPAVAASNAPVQVAQLQAEPRAKQTEAPVPAAAANGITPYDAATKTLAKDEETALVDDRQVHREASLGVAVDTLEASSDKVEEMVKAAGGYVASNNLTTDTNGYKSAQLTVRVPVKEFDAILSSISKLGDVQSKNVTGEDITEQVSDVTSDEQVLVDEVDKVGKQVQEQRMSDKRTDQKEAELRQLQLQLARTRARLGLLRKMAALSTINVSLTEKAKKAAVAPDQPGWLHDLRETNRAAMVAFQSAVRVPIVMVVWILAFSPIWVPLILAYRWASIKSMARQALSPSNPGEMDRKA